MRNTTQFTCFTGTQILTQRTSSQTLGKLAWGNAEHQNKIATEGGIEAIVAGMKAHPSRLNVSQQVLVC
jgi:hypothetical protein